MKELFLIVILFEFFSFSIEKISIIKKRLNCEHLNESLEDITQQIFNNKNENYGFNPQNCQLRNKDNGFDCCYISLYFDKKWYNFCAQFIKDVGEKFINNIFMNITNLNDDNKTKIIKNIKIDCFSKKLNIFNRLYLIILMSLIFSYF